VRRALALLLFVPALALIPGKATAAAPDAVGWWNALHRSAVPLAPPPPPDVVPGELLLQGGDVQRELPGTAPAPTAYAALRYAVPDGSEVAGLTLEVEAGAQAADVRAYATTSPWQPAENGAIEAAPVPDLSRYAVATLSSDGSRLTFTDIGKLTTIAGLLDVVLLPGVSDRLVVKHPSAAALTLTGPAQPGPALPPPPVVPAPALPAVAPAPAAALPPIQAGPPQLASTVPAPAPAPRTAEVPARQVLGSAELVGDDARARWVVGLEALLVATFFGLLGQGPLSGLARLTGVPREQGGAERGIGRFRTVRAGAVPRL
jgi:hypothetical protein